MENNNIIIERRIYFIQRILLSSSLEGLISIFLIFKSFCNAPKGQKNPQYILPYINASINGIKVMAKRDMFLMEGKSKFNILNIWYRDNCSCNINPNITTTNN